LSDILESPVSQGLDTSTVATSSIMTESTTVTTEATEKEKLDTLIDDAVVQLSSIENEERWLPVHYDFLG